MRGGEHEDPLESTPLEAPPGNAPFLPPVSLGVIQRETHFGA